MRLDDVPRERLRNPFHELLVTELLEDPGKFRMMFSPEVLVGESLQVFRPANTVVVGPQGSGKSMLLNLLRYPVVGAFLHADARLPDPLENADPYLGISVNLVRVNFAHFGARTISHSRGLTPEPHLDASAAFDFISHTLLREFLKSVEYMGEPQGRPFAKWAHLERLARDQRSVASVVSEWTCWNGWYAGSQTVQDLIKRCESRLATWRNFLNANLEVVPPQVWATKCTPEEPLHAIGNYLRDISSTGSGTPLYVTFDQYEVLPELNTTFGTTLQRVLNNLIKARDPVVFYKIGARTYDWGRELRVWPGDSRIEENRDFRALDLASLLVRKESGRRIFPRVAADVVRRRIALTNGTAQHSIDPSVVFGSWTAEDESWSYFKKRRARAPLLQRSEVRSLTRGIPDNIAEALLALLGEDVSPLEVRLASAWALQRLQRKRPMSEVLDAALLRPWNHKWWKKERIGVALIQIASAAFQKKLYYGWQNIVYLAGGNVSALIYIVGETWDQALRNGEHPIEQSVSKQAQSEGIRRAAMRWFERDRNELSRGAKRFQVVQRLGQQISDYLLADAAMSNPGHSGFSVSESDLFDDEFEKEREFLLTAVHWAILEERQHASKEQDGDRRRRKFFLHPLLSPIFNLPTSRVKEPLYTRMAVVRDLIQSPAGVLFVRSGVSTRRPPVASAGVRTKTGVKAGPRVTIPRHHR